MDREDTIEIRVFFQCQNPDEVFCIFIRGGRGRATWLFNIRHFTLVIEMAATVQHHQDGINTIMKYRRYMTHTIIRKFDFKVIQNFLFLVRLPILEFYQKISMNLNMLLYKFAFHY